MIIPAVSKKTGYPLNIAHIEYTHAVRVPTVTRVSIARLPDVTCFQVALWNCQPKPNTTIVVRAAWIM